MQTGVAAENGHSHKPQHVGRKPSRCRHRVCDYILKSRGKELVWLDVHKDPDVFSRETILSLSNDSVSRLWNHVTTQFRAWERAPQPPKHSQGMLPAEFSKEQYAKPGGGSGATTAPSPAPSRRRTKRRWSVLSRRWKAGARVLRRIGVPGHRRCGTLLTRLNDWEQQLQLPSTPFALSCWLNSTSLCRGQ